MTGEDKSFAQNSRVMNEFGMNLKVGLLESMFLVKKKVYHKIVNTFFLRFVYTFHNAECIRLCRVPGISWKLNSMFSMIFFSMRKFQILKLKPFSCKQ